MAAPEHVPSTVNPPLTHISAPRRPESWIAERPGEVLGCDAPLGPGTGNQGPDQGYMLKLAEDIADLIIIAPNERREDALAACCAVALRRASLFGRAPVVHDLQLAIELFGYPEEAPDDLAEWRIAQFDGMSGRHGYHIRQRLAEMVPEATLLSTPASVRKAQSVNWRSALGLQPPRQRNELAA